MHRKTRVTCSLIPLLLATSLPSVAQATDFGIDRAGRAAEPTDYRYTLPPTPQRDLIIAPLMERPLGVEEGPTLEVEAFDLIGFDIVPGVRLTRQEVDHLVAEERRVHNNLFTIGQLQLLADQITNLYRERGAILAHAYIPAQEVVAGRVRIEMLQGALGGVVFEGPSDQALIFKEQALQLPFNRLLGEAVTIQNVERALFTLSDYPGISFFGMFRPGSQLGETELLVKIDQQPRAIYGIGADNHGSLETGEYRLYADLTLNSLTGYADRLYAKLQHSLSPAKAVYGEIEYWLPKLHADYDLGVRVSRSDYQIAGTILQEGVVDDLELSSRWRAIRGRTFNVTPGADLSLRRYTTEGDLGAKEDNLTIGSLRVALDHNDEWLANLFGPHAHGVTQGLIRYSHGFGNLLGSMEASDALSSSRIGAGGVRAGGAFDRLDLSLLRYQALTPQRGLLFKLRGQYSPDMLVPIEQLALGGPTSVRAYPAAQYLADSGLQFSLEYQQAFPGLSDKPAPWGSTWGESLRLIAFADYGWGENNRPLRSEEGSQELVGAGLGLRLNVPERMQVSLTVATPVGREDPANERDPQYFFDLRYSFGGRR